ncbi:unnamed protein product [Urochloa humidicola]
MMFKLKVATMEQAASRVFNLQGNKPRAAPTSRSPLQMFQNVYRMAEEEGNESWFGHHNTQASKVLRARTHPPIPVQQAFYRIKNAIPPGSFPTIQEVDDALTKMVDDATQRSGEDEQLQVADSEPATPLQATPMTNTTAQVCTPTPLPTTESANLSGVADLFVTPEQGILSQTAPMPAPARRGRRLKKPAVTVSSLRRSKRQAVSRLKHMPAEQRANHVLCRRLGYIKDDLTPAEEAIREFVSSFQGPMPQDIVAAMTAIFRLDDDDACGAIDALIRLGGPEAADGVPELNDEA